jgi:hypothetical protein
MRVHSARISKPRGGYEDRKVSEFWLTEPQATTILLQLRTPQARRVRVGVVKVFMAVHNGLLSTPQQVPVPVLPTSPTLGDLYRADLKSRCAMCARCTGESIHRVHGWLRSQYKVSGVYQINGAFHEQVCRQLESWALGRVPLPSRAPRSLTAVAESTQGVLRFSEVRP